MKLTDKQKNRIGLSASLFVACILILLGQLERWKIKQDGVYVIGTVQNYKPARKGVSMHYSFKYNGVEYKDAVSSTYEEKKECPIGTHFFLIVKKGDCTSHYFADAEDPVPDWFPIESPPEGWEVDPTGEDRPTNSMMRRWLREDAKTKENGVYTIGRVRYYISAEEEWSMHYSYTYKGKDHFEEIPFSNDKKEEFLPGTRFFLLLKEDEPDFRLVLDPVPDWFTLESPFDGWPVQLTPNGQPSDSLMRVWMGRW